MAISAEILDALSNEGLIPRGMRWVAQAGGRTNSVWRVDVPSGALVCKLYEKNRDNPLYPNLPGLEYEALKALHRFGISPEPVALLNTTAGDLLVYRHLEGTTWRAGSAGVAELLHRLHTLDISLPLPVSASGSAALEAQIKNILQSCPVVPEQFPVVAVPECPPVPNPRLIHTDVVASNIIVTRGGLRLIDWQCPAIGDPTEDLASFLSPAMQSLYGVTVFDRRERETFLSAYPDQSIVDRYRTLAPLYHLRIAAYCLWKSAAGAADYGRAMRLELNALEQA